MAVFSIAGLFFAIYLSGGFFDSRGILCHISKWRFFLIAGLFFAIYLSQYMAKINQKRRHSDI